MYRKFIDLVKLMRINQPIGFFLLLWPTLWGLWIASEGKPNISIVLLFIAGVLCMRSAGCIINDYIDCDIDKCVYRTRNRPLVNATATITKKEALVAFYILIFISIGLICIFSVITILLSCVAFILSIIYPFLKRYVYLPQLILGIIFSSPILITSVAVQHPIDNITWLWFIANTIWTISYDTQYAMVDRNDDQNIAIKSSALLFGKLDKFIIGILQFITVSIFFIIALEKQLSIFFYLFAILGSSILFIWQQILIYDRKPAKCFRAFLNNNYIGMLVFIGVVLSFYRIL